MEIQFAGGFLGRIFKCYLSAFWLEIVTGLRLRGHGSIFGDLPVPKSPQIAISYDLIGATNPIYSKPQATKSHLKKERIRLSPILQVTSTSGDQGEIRINRCAYSQSRSHHEERMTSHEMHTTPIPTMTTDEPLLSVAHAHVFSSGLGFKIFGPQKLLPVSTIAVQSLRNANIV